MRKLLITIISALVCLPAMAQDLPKLNKLEYILAEAGSKSLYLTRDCDKPIDPEKFKDMADVKAVMEGFQSADEVNWDSIKLASHIKYAELKTEAPMGEYCAQYKKEVKGKYKWLKDIDEL